ncbi:MAG: hypothetical protein GWP61_00050 [Chloroflexi bacterium]|jgi:hypothetical protein|nr:hypothetical protein [Chloroflexota bacterium]
MMIVCLTGEAGIGKTRLAEELMTWASRLGITTATANCYAGGGLSFEPVITWLRSPEIKSVLNDLKALEFAVEAGNLSREIGNGWNMAYASWVQGMVHDALGNWGRAQILYQESRRIGDEVGLLMALTAVPLQLGTLWRRLGQVGQAEAIHREALAASEAAAPLMLRALEAALALDAFAGGESAEGYRWQVKANAREPMGDIGTSLALTIPVTAAVTAAQHNNQWHEALSAVEEDLHEARRRQLLIHELPLGYEFGRCLAGQQKFAEAETQLGETLSRAEQIGLLPLALDCSKGLISLFRTLDIPDKATSYEQQAGDIARQLADSLMDVEQSSRFLAYTAV